MCVTVRTPVDPALLQEDHRSHSELEISVKVAYADCVARHAELMHVAIAGAAVVVQNWPGDGQAVADV